MFPTELTKGMHRGLPLIVLCLSLCAAGGCSFMAPQPDRTQYFILSPAAQDGTIGVAPASQASTSQLSIGVGPLRFPDYLKRPWVVTRAASNRLTVSDLNRWAEPLDRNFEGTLCQNLAQVLGTQKIVTYPWYADIHVDYQVQVWVSRFETSDDGRSQLSANWAIAKGRDGSELAAGQSDISSQVQAGENGPSAALSRDLAQMSRQIADRIAQLSAVSKSGSAELNVPSSPDALSRVFR
jgi:uncharacterized protein